MNKLKQDIIRSTSNNILIKVMASLRRPDGAIKLAFPYVGKNRESAQ